MLRRPALILVFVWLTASTQIKQIRSHNEDYVIECYPSFDPPVMDGRRTTDREWIDNVDVKHVRMKQYGPWQGIGYLAVKYDTKFLYGFVDLVSDTDLYKDTLHVLFDPEHDGGQDRMPDDLQLMIFPQRFPIDGETALWQLFKGGKEISVENIKCAASVDSASDPYSKIPHLHYEFRIGRELLGNKTTIGFSVIAIDGTDKNFIINWPPGFYTTKRADYWGDLVYMAEPIPEFSNRGIVLLGALCCVLLLFGRSRSKKQLLSRDRPTNLAVREVVRH